MKFLEKFSGDDEIEWPDKHVVIDETLVKRGDIPSLFDDTFYSSYEVWRRFKLFGLPTGSSLEERDVILDVIEIWESKVTEWQGKDTEKRLKK